MAHQTQELSKQFPDLIETSFGEHCSFDNISGFEFQNSNSLIFIQNIDQFDINKVPAAIVTTHKVATELETRYQGFIACVADVKVAQALIKQHFDDYQVSDLEWPAIHATAIIHKSVKLGQNCRIGPNVTIGKDCKIGDNVIVRANAVIEHSVAIGNDSIINSLANIGYGCELGERVIVQSSCVIGNEGYGFATDKSGRHHRIPHTGNVVLHDDVHIGSGTCIDRGTYGSTVVNRGVKIDNLCHIAHNVEVGENCLIVAQCGIAGSSVIGKRVMMSGQTGVLDHKTIADDCVFVLRAAVTKDITQTGMWAGIPARPFKEHVRELRLSKKIQSLEKEIRKLKNSLTDK